MAFGLGKAADGGFAVDTIDELRQQAIELFTIDGMVAPMEDPVRSVLVQRMTDKMYQLQMVALDVYNMMNVSIASGANLDLLASNIGILRKRGIAQTLSVKLTSVNVGPGYTIPVDTLFATTDGMYTYKTLAPISVSDSTPITVSVQAVSNGDNPVVVGGKLVSQSYIPQLSDIEIMEITTAGTADETDESVRLRFWGKVLSFIGTIPFMLDKLREIDLLRKVGENHNNTGAVDSDGLDPYSTEFLVLPYTGTDINAVNAAVAQKIVSFMLPGLPTFGSTTITIPDYRGRDRVVKFTVPTSIGCEIFFKIGPKEDGTFSDTSAASQIQRMADYINNLDIGTDVSMTELWGIIAPNATFDILDYGIRRVGSPTWIKGNLAIGSREAAIVDTANIKIGPDAGE